MKTALTDRYGIQEELGAGDMATAYLAHDIEHDSKVAMKVLRPEFPRYSAADVVSIEIAHQLPSGPGFLARSVVGGFVEDEHEHGQDRIDH